MGLVASPRPSCCFRVSCSSTFFLPNRTQSIQLHPAAHHTYKLASGVFCVLLFAWLLPRLFPHHTLASSFFSFLLSPWPFALSILRILALFRKCRYSNHSNYAYHRMIGMIKFTWLSSSMFNLQFLSENSILCGSKFPFFRPTFHFHFRLAELCGMYSSFVVPKMRHIKRLNSIHGDLWPIPLHTHGSRTWCKTTRNVWLSILGTHKVHLPFHKGHIRNRALISRWEMTSHALHNSHIPHFWLISKWPKLSSKDS